eukprot:229783-Prymnesium_polylepis.1
MFVVVSSAAPLADGGLVEPPSHIRSLASTLPMASPSGVAKGCFVPSAVTGSSPDLVRGAIAGLTAVGLTAAGASSDCSPWSSSPCGRAPPRAA